MLLCPPVRFPWISLSYLAVRVGWRAMATGAGGAKSNQMVAYVATDACTRGGGGKGAGAAVAQYGRSSSG